MEEGKFWKAIGVGVDETGLRGYLMLKRIENKHIPWEEFWDMYIYSEPRCNEITF